MKNNNPAIFALGLIIALALSAIAYANSAPVLTSIVGGAKEKEPFESSLAGYWDMDDWNGTYILDKTSNNNDGLIYGANRSNGKLGYGMVFDSENDYIDTGSGLGLALNKTMTVEFWAKLPKNNSMDAVTNFATNWVGVASGWSVDFLASRHLRFYYTSCGWPYHVVETSINYTNDTWNHIAVTVVSAGSITNTTFYINGLKENFTDAFSFCGNTTTPISIGKIAAYNYFNGSIDEVKIYNKALSADEVAKHYSQGIGTGNITAQTPLAVSVNVSSDADNDVLYTAVDWYKNGILNATTGKPDDANLTLFMPFDARNTTGTVEDYSIMNNDGTISGAVFTNDSAVGLGAMSFDGTDDYIFKNDAKFDADGNWSLEAWIKINGGNMQIFSAGDSVDTLNPALRIDAYPTGIGVWRRDDSNNELGSGAAGSITAGVWTHVAYIYNSSAIMRYINGVDVGSAAWTTGSLSTEDIAIGALRRGRTGVMGFFNGSIDEISIYNRSLSASEIMQHYQASKLKGLILNNSETKKNEKWNATITLYDNSTAASAPMNFSFSQIEDIIANVIIGVNNTAPKINEVVNVSANATDADGLSFCLIKTNQTGAFTNTTYQLTGINDTCSKAITITVNHNNAINFTVEINDTAGDVIYRESARVIVANTVPTLSTLNGGAKEKEPFDSSLAGYWDMDSWNATHVLDRTSNINHGLIVGGANRSNGKLGYGMVFDGVDDYVDAGNGASLNLSTAITIEAWIKPNSLVNQFDGLGIVDKFWDGSKRSYALEMSKGVAGITTGGEINFILGTADGSDAYLFYTGDLNMQIGNWYHIVATYSQSSGTKVYKNGIQSTNTYVQKGTKTDAIATNTQTVKIGDGVIGAGGSYFNGTIDEVRIYNYALSADEIAKHYSQGIGTGNITAQTPLAVSVNVSSDADNDVLYTAVDWYKNGILNATTGKPDDANLTLFMPFDARNTTGTVEDYSIMNNDGAINGATFTNDSAMGWGAMSFDGVDDYVQVADSNSLDITNNITLEAWVKLGKISAAADQAIITKWDDAVDGGRSYRLVFETTNKFYIDVSADAGAVSRRIFATTNTFTSANAWYHVVVTADVAADDYKIYVNGANQPGTKTFSAISSIYVSTSNLTLGYHPVDTALRWFNGTIDEVRIYNRSLTASEVSQHYQASKLKGLILNNSETKKNEKWNATVTLYDDSTAASTPINFSFSQLQDTAANVTIGINNTSPKINEVVNVSANATDADGLSWCLIKNNQTGAYTNSTYPLTGTNDTCSKAITITVNHNNAINFTVEINDTAGDVIYRESARVIVANTVPTLSTLNGGAKEKEPFDSSLAGYWDMDSWNATHVMDRTSNNNDGLIYSANRSNGKLGYGMVFDGVDDWVNVTDSPSLVLNYMTVELWFKANAFGDFKALLTKGNTGSDKDYTFDITPMADGTIRYYVGDGTTFNSITSSSALSTNMWYHAVFTYDKVNLKMYINGVSAAAPTASTITPVVNTRPVAIGRNELGPSYSFNGLIDEVKIYNRALSADEVANHYSQGIGTGNITTQNPLAVSVNSSSDADSDVLYTAVDWYKNGILNATTGKPDDTATVLFMPFDARNTTGTVSDYSIFNNTGTIIGATFTNDSAMGLGAMQFDGVDDYVDCGNKGSLNLGGGNFTIEFWAYIKSLADDKTIIASGNSGFYKDHPYMIVTNTNTIWYVDGNGVSYENVAMSPAPSLNTWVHAVAVKSGTNLQWYLNGATRGSGTLSYTPAGFARCQIGTMNSGSWMFNGFLDEFHIYNRSLTASEVMQHYQASKLKGLILNNSETKKNEKWNATVTLYDPSFSASTPINFSFGTITSCGYLASEGNWEIDGEDGCVLDRNYNLGGNNIIINGTGNFRFNSYNITNYGNLTMRGTSATERLIVTCDNGGCFKR